VGPTVSASNLNSEKDTVTQMRVTDSVTQVSSVTGVMCRCGSKCVATFNSVMAIDKATVL
jgi:bacterioferritin-associated ferredoxin